MYNEYKIEYSYMTTKNRRIIEEDTSISDNAQAAVDSVRNWYNGLPGLRIERVYRANGNRWEVCEWWD